VGGADRDPFDLVERDFIAGPVVELCRPWGLVSGDRLRVLDRAPVLKVGSDPGSPEGVAARRVG